MISFSFLLNRENLDTHTHIYIYIERESKSALHLNHFHQRFHQQSPQQRLPGSQSVHATKKKKKKKNITDAGHIVLLNLLITDHADFIQKGP